MKKKFMLMLMLASCIGVANAQLVVDEADFSITVTDASNTMVYVGTHITRETTIPLPQLPEGNYYLRIEDEEYTYCGKLEIE